MNKLQFNISCNTAEEAISEVQKLEKAFNKPIECYVNIVMDEEKEPTELTIDPKKIITNQINANDIASQSLVIKNKNSEITFSGTKVEIKAQSITGV